MKVAVCGKGGSGKSVITTLLATALQKKDYKILIIDSDESNSSLYRMLGFENPPVPLMDLIGGKKMVQKALRPKNSLEKLEFQNNILTQETIHLNEIPTPYIQLKNGLYLVSIGKILQSLEGCACPMGVLTREFLNKLDLKFDEITLVDMEAGVEHFGRGVEENMDIILIIVEPSFESLHLAIKINDLAKGIGKNKIWIIINKVSSDVLLNKLENELNKRDLKVIGSIATDSDVFMTCLEGKPVKGRDIAQAVDKIAVELLSEAR